MAADSCHDLATKLERLCTRGAPPASYHRLIQTERHTVPVKALAGLGAASTLALLAGCGATTTPSSGSPAATTSPQPPATAVPSEPVTAAAARSAAESYFALYGAGQYAAVYPMISPADQAFITPGIWTGLHAACPSKAAGLSYTVSRPVLAGDVAVFSVGLAGAASALGSEQVTFTYSGSKWYYSPSDLHVYKHHDLAQAITAAKADGLC
jgi:hypothetical protein